VKEKTTILESRLGGLEPTVNTSTLRKGNMQVIAAQIWGPEFNTGENVFVFGSNRLGVHGAGAAKQAAQHWGAVRGVSLGRTGMSYAIPTKNHWRDCFGLPLDIIQRYVEDFISYARVHNQTTFLVTKIGCGFAGHKESDIAPMFKDAPENCVLPAGWR
jgi:hypothetical protein